MSEQPAGTKVCGDCGTDITSKPRVKDAQGHYYCKECAAKRQASLAKKVNKTSGPGVGATAGDADIMSRLVDESIAKGAVSCPACRRPWKEGALICTGCGFNKESGQIVGTQIKEAEIIKDKAAPTQRRGRGGAARFKGSHWKVALIVGGLYLGGFVLAIVNKEFAQLFVLATLLYFTILPFVAAFHAYTETDSALKAALVFLCGPYLIFYCALETENDLLKGTAWAAILLIILLVVAVLAMGMAAGMMGGGLGPPGDGAVTPDFILGR